jgi:hypothetical protein
MTFPPAQRWLSVILAVTCAGVGLSALAMISVAAFVSLKPAWLVIGFEAVAVVAALLGLREARARLVDAPGLSLGCVALVFGPAAFLAWLSVRGKLEVGGSVDSVSITPWLAGRLAAAALVGAIGAFLVLGRNPRSIHYLKRSAWAATPLAIGGVVAFVLMRTGAAAFVASLPGIVTGMVLTVVGLIAVILVSATLHCLIRAFEMGRDMRRDA